MPYILLLILITILNSIPGYGQSETELENIKRIDSVIFANLKLGKKHYLTYSIDSRILIVEDVGCLHYLDLEKGYIRSDRIVKDSILSLFNKNNIQLGKLFSDQDFNNSCISSFLYLSIRRRGVKKFQFNLPSLLLCDNRKIIYPFDYRELQILHSLFLKF